MEMIKVVNNAESTDIYVTGIIEDDSWKMTGYEDEDTYPSDIKNLLKDAKDTVNVYINSGGGDMFAGVAISNMLKRFTGKTKAIVDGIAASAASIIAFGCDEITMPSNSYLMIHKPSSYVIGNANDFKKMADTLETLQKGLVETYTSLAKEGVTSEKINQMIDDETWLTGKEASEYFNIEVIEAKKVENSKLGVVYNMAKVPENLKNDDKKNPDEGKKVVNEDEIERKIKEIEIALSL